MNNVTYTNGFRSEDITFKNARRQSEIIKELGMTEDDNTDAEDVTVPVSLTPEQVEQFYTSKIKTSKDSNEKRLYSQTLVWLKELVELRKEVIALKLKEKAKEESEEDVGDDI